MSHFKRSILGIIGILLFTGFGVVTVSAQYDYAFGWGSHGADPGQFVLPRGIAVDNPGNVYIADGDNNRIQVFSPKGEFLRQWGSLGEGDGQFNHPFSLLVYHGQIYVTDEGNNRVQVFMLDGTYVSQWDTGKVLGEPSSGPDTPFMPVSICVNSSGYFFVGGGGGIKVYSPEMTFVTSIGTFGSGEDQLQVVYGLAFNSTGYLYASDTINNRIRIISPENEIVATFGEMGSGPGQFLFPMGLAINNQDLIYVADIQNYRMEVLDPSGNYLAEWGSQGTGPGQFNTITELAIVAPQGGIQKSELIYVSDLFNDRIQVFALNPPEPGFSGTPTSGSAPLGVMFIDTSTGFVTSYLWDFGDGSTSRVQNPIHWYTKGGRYTVRLTASNSAGSSTTTAKEYITVTDPSGSFKPGGTIYIGQTVDISCCVSPGDMIGWWSSSSDKLKTLPNMRIEITDPESFYAAPSIFSGRTGIWYLMDPSTGFANGKIFKIENPKG